MKNYWHMKKVHNQEGEFLSASRVLLINNNGSHLQNWVEVESLKASRLENNRYSCYN